MFNPLKTLATHPMTQQGFDASQTVVVDINPSMIVMVNEMQIPALIEGLTRPACVVALCGAGAILVPMSRDEFFAEVGFAGLTAKSN